MTQRRRFKPSGLRFLVASPLIIYLILSGGFVMAQDGQDAHDKSILDTKAALKRSSDDLRSKTGDVDDDVTTTSAPVQNTTTYLHAWGEWGKGMGIFIGTYFIIIAILLLVVTVVAVALICACCSTHPRIVAMKQNMFGGGPGGAGAGAAGSAIGDPKAPSDGKGKSAAGDKPEKSVSLSVDSTSTTTPKSNP